MLFNHQNAREMARRSNEVQRERRRNTLTAQPSCHADNFPEYASRRLTRVRRQLDRIDRLMMTENDPQKLDRLASAQTRLREQERILSGRPLRGSLRPAKASATHQLSPPID